MPRWLTIAAVYVALTLAAAARAQTGLSGEFDACGVLVRDGNCVLFDGGGGRYSVSPFDDDFNVGDAVRVVGTLDENCITICGNADGCIRGALMYDPASFPCGTPIKVPFDPCSGLSAALAGLGGTALWLTRPRRGPAES